MPHAGTGSRGWGGVGSSLHFHACSCTHMSVCTLLCASRLAPVHLQVSPWAPARTKSLATAGPGAECIPMMALSSGCHRSGNFFAAASPKALGGAERLRLSRSVSPQGYGGCRWPSPLPRVTFLHPAAWASSQQHPSLPGMDHPASSLTADPVLRSRAAVSAQDGCLPFPSARPTAPCRLPAAFLGSFGGWGFFLFCFRLGLHRGRCSCSRQPRSWLRASLTHLHGRVKDQGK